MGRKNRIVFLTAEHLDEQANARDREAKLLPDGEARQHALNNAAQLRTYAAMKRGFALQVAKSKP